MSLVIPIVLLANHFTQIVIGFIINPLHATSVGLISNSKVNADCWDLLLSSD